VLENLYYKNCHFLHDVDACMGALQKLIVFALWRQEAGVLQILMVFVIFIFWVLNKGGRDITE